MNQQGNYFPQLTGLRAIAAYLVYLFHYPIAPFVSLFLQLNMGVGIFFTLSGFLIYYRYAESYTGTKQWWKTYILNRFARIYPLYFILTIVALGYASASFFEWFAHLTLLRGFFLGLAHTGVEPGWTLTIEECFYLSAPLLFLAFRRGKFWSPLFIIYGIGVLLTLLGQRINYYGFFIDFSFTAYNTYFGRAFEFFLGMYLAKKFVAESAQPPAEKVSPKWRTLVGGLGIIGLVLFRAWLEPTLGINYAHPISIALTNLVAPCFNSLLLWGLLIEESWLRRFLASPTMVLLGKSSYAFYLIHTGMIAIIVLFLSSQLVFNDYLALLLHFILMNLMAIGLFRFVEEPLNLLIRGRWQPKQKLALGMTKETD